MGKSAEIFLKFLYKCNLWPTSTNGGSDSKVFVFDRRKKLRRHKS